VALEEALEVVLAAALAVVLAAAVSLVVVLVEAGKLSVFSRSIQFAVAVFNI